MTSLTEVQLAADIQRNPDEVHSCEMEKVDITAAAPQAGEDAFEIFKNVESGVQYRTLGWIKASVIFLKIIFATGVLSIPSTYVVLGAAGGASTVVLFGVVNTIMALVLGAFRNRHPGVHTVADIAHHIGGPIAREIVGMVYLIANVLVAGSGILGVTVGLNALSENAVCSLVMSAVSMIAVAAMASIPKFQQISWTSWAGCFSIIVAIFIVVIASTQQDRPYAAPSGDYELGYYVVAPKPTFVAATTAVVNIFGPSAGHGAFIPVMSEMKRPQDFPKAVILCMSIVTGCYLMLSLILYRWCGQWVASPALSSAGPLITKIAYGIGLFGLLASGMIYAHVGAKYLFVRILRNSKHLQANSFIHWATWLSCSIGLTVISWTLAEAVPIFNYVIALSGSICFAPLALCLPAIAFIYDHRRWVKHGSWVQMLSCCAMTLVFLVGCYFCVGGTYSVVRSIIDAYDTGSVGGVFSCANHQVSTT